MTEDLLLSRFWRKVDLLKHVGQRFMRDWEAINKPGPEKPRKRVEDDDFPWQK